MNAGNVQNTGVELMIGGTPVEIKDFSWKTGINYAFNKNKVVRLHGELPVFQYGPYGFSSSYAMKLKKGASAAAAASATLSAYTPTRCTIPARTATVSVTRACTSQTPVRK